MTANIQITSLIQFISNHYPLKQLIAIKANFELSRQKISPLSLVKLLIFCSLHNHQLSVNGLKSSALSIRETVNSPVKKQTIGQSHVAIDETPGAATKSDTQDPNSNPKCSAAIYITV